MASRAKRGEIALAVALIVLSGIIWYGAAKLPPPYFDPIGSAAFPKAMAIVITGLSLIMVTQSFRVSDERPVAEGAGEFPRPRYLLAVAMYGLMIIYAAIMQEKLLGFAPSTMLFVITAGAILGRFRLRQLLVSIAISIVLGYGGEYVFTRVFFIDLPV